MSKEQNQNPENSSSRKPQSLNQLLESNTEALNRVASLMESLLTIVRPPVTPAKDRPEGGLNG